MALIPIATQTLTSTATSVTFSSIPTSMAGQSLRDLVLVAQYNGLAGNNLLCRFNSDTGSNYDSVWMVGYVGSAFSQQNQSDRLILTIGSDGLSDITMNIMDYAQTNKHKATLSRSGSVNSISTEAFTGRWASTSAINSVQLYGGTFAIGSTFALYGVAA